MSLMKVVVTIKAPAPAPTTIHPAVISHIKHTVIVKDPPIDFEDVMGDIRSQGRSQDPKGNLGTVPPVCGPLGSYVPDRNYSDRTMIKPTPYTSGAPRREIAVACPWASEPTVPLLGDHQAGLNSKFPAAGVSAPCRLNKNQ